MLGGVLQGWIASAGRRVSALALSGVVAAGLAAMSAPVVAQAAFDRAGPVSPGTDWIVMDVATGKILSEHNPYTTRYPASLTKLMTLDLAFRDLRSGHLSTDTKIPVSQAAASVQPVKLNLVVGQTITVRQAMLGMTTLSANDAATALGQYLGRGSIRRFATTMTAEAHALGMQHTQFYNPSGLPNSGQVTDAYDMALLTRHILLTYPQYRYLFSVASFNFEGRPIPNIDGMLKLYPGAIGMKTGYTDLARFNLVTAAVRNGHMLIGVEMHARSWHTAYQTMTKLLDQGFAEDGAGHNTVIAMRDPLPAIVPQARAATRTHVVTRRVTATAADRRQARVHHIVEHSGHVTQDMVPGWTAQVGAYDNYQLARRQALKVRTERHVGTARVGSAVVHHHRIYRAQLAGLDHHSARLTCSLLKRHHQSCFVIAPRPESLAMR